MIFLSLMNRSTRSIYSVAYLFNLSYNSDNTMENLYEQLIGLGLSDYEARIYETLLITSPLSATAIAKKCNLSRSSIYTTLGILSEKGLVGTSYKNSVKQFVAEDITELETLVVKEKKAAEKKLQLVEELKKSLPQLRRAIHIPNIIFFEGQEGLKKIYLSMMRQAEMNSTLYLLRDEFVWRPEWKFIFEEEWHARIKRWKKEKNISTKLLVNESLLEKKEKAFYAKKKSLQVRYLDKKNTISGFAQYILGDTIAILSIEKNNLVGIQITNNHLADNYRKIFASLWGNSR